MDAIRIARAHTGRDVVLKIFGSYHGHHDSGDGLDRRRVRPDRRPRRPRLAAVRRRDPAGGRRPDRRRCRSTTPSAMERRIERLAAEGRLPACLIMEAAMMNLGVVLPEPGYLEAVREITAPPRDRPDLRRGEDGADGRRRRRGRALRRRPRPGHAREDARRGAAVRRDRRDRGGDGLRRGRKRLPGRHVQRQPADDGGGAGEPVRGAHAGRVRAPPPAERAAARGLRRRGRASTGCPATRSGSARRAASRSRPSASSTTRRSRRTRTSS